MDNKIGIKFIESSCRTCLSIDINLKTITNTSIPCEDTDILYSDMLEVCTSVQVSLAKDFVLKGTYFCNTIRALTPSLLYYSRLMFVLKRFGCRCLHSYLTEAQCLNKVGDLLGLGNFQPR